MDDGRLRRAARAQSNSFEEIALDVEVKRSYGRLLITTPLLPSRASASLFIEFVFIATLMLIIVFFSNHPLARNAFSLSTSICAMAWYIAARFSNRCLIDANAERIRVTQRQRFPLPWLPKTNKTSSIHGAHVETVRKMHETTQHISFSVRLLSTDGRSSVIVRTPRSDQAEAIANEVSRFVSCKRE